MGCDYYQKYVNIQNYLKCFLYHTVNIATACKITKLIPSSTSIYRIRRSGDIQKKKKRKEIEGT